MELTLFVLSVIGMTNIIVDSSLFETPREIIKNNSPFWGKVVECHQCCGFWSGLVCGAFILIPYGTGYTTPLTVFLYGCAGSVLASTYVLITEYVLSKIEFHEN